MSRSIKKGPFVDGHLQKKVDEANKTGQKKVIKTSCALISLLSFFFIVTRMF